jgi:hypothetical protein
MMEIDFRMEKKEKENKLSECFMINATMPLGVS